MCFKSCPRVGGIQCQRCLMDWKKEVSSRAPVWGASPTKARNSSIKEFQVVPPCGGHHGRWGHRPLGRSGFKSCPRVGGIEDTLSPANTIRKFQVVPPCGGHPKAAAAGAVKSIVSSRAPVWGASDLSVQRVILPSVSSRAPVWGASSGACTVRW